MEPLHATRIQWAPIVAAIGVGALLLLTNGCANDHALVDVSFSTEGSDAPGEATPTPDPDNPDGTPTPMPTPTDDPDEPDPAPTPSLTCGTVVIRDLRIDGANGGHISFRPWADLELANPNGSTVDDLGVSADTYDRVRFTVHKRTGSDSGGPGTGDPAVNHSMHLCGTYQGIAWDYLDDTTFDIDRRDATGVVVDGDGPAKLFVVFDSAHWFDGLDLLSVTPAADGVVYMDHDVNHDLQDAFRQNFKDSVKLGNEAHGSH